MKISPQEKRIFELIILQYLTRQEGTKIIPEDIRTKFTPEMIEFTLAELQSKGLVEYFEGAYTPTKKAQELFKKVKPIRDEIIAFGHPKISAESRVKIKITKKDQPKEDCVIGVRANKSARELNPEIKERLKLGEKVKISISINEVEEKISAYGSPALELSDEECIVITKTDSIEKGTIAIFADKSASDLGKALKEELKNENEKIKIVLEI
jgi:hypothetical protein